MAELKKAFVIGSPIHHSKSPILHGHWLETLNLPGSYEAILVQPEDLEKFVHDFRKSDFLGGNITIPHKEKMVDLVDQLTPAAKAIGAVNTLWREGDTLIGDNTDAYGFAANLDDLSPGWDKGKTAIVIGAGGASRAIIYKLIERSFNKIIIANRTLSRAEALAREFGPTCLAFDMTNIDGEVQSADFIVNTTALGMKEDDPLPIDLSSAKPDCVVTDIVYTPLETPFLNAAKKLHLRHVDGLGMLLHQAVPGFEKWFGTRPEVTKNLRAAVLRPKQDD